MFAVGVVCLVVAVIWIGYKVYLSYSSCGGTVVMILYDAAIYPPLLIAFGLYQVMSAAAVQWPLWAYGAIAVGGILVVILLIRIAERVGDREPY